MEFTRSRQGSYLEIAVTGRLDANGAEVLDTELQEVIRSGEHRLRLNMAGVLFISSAGIRVLLKYLQSVRKLGGFFGVTAPTPQVRSVIQMVGLSPMLVAEPAEPAAEKTSLEAAASGARTWREGSLILEAHPLSAGSTFQCCLMGDPTRLVQGAVDGAESRRLELLGDTFALGVGALGENPEDCQGRYGEFLAAAGSVAHLPADGTRLPDYMSASGRFIPQVQALYAVVGRGSPAWHLRFEAEAKNPIPLSGLIRQALTVLQAPDGGFIIAAESAGLIGVALRKSPDAATGWDDLFRHPEIRQWLAFTSERVHDRSLAFIVGLAATGSGNARSWNAMLRPLTPHDPLTGHFHAAAFTYRAMPKGFISLQETTKTLFEEQKLLGLLHLVNDSREINGNGESLLLRGAIWMAPLAESRPVSPPMIIQNES